MLMVLIPDLMRLGGVFSHHFFMLAAQKQAVPSEEGNPLPPHPAKPLALLRTTGNLCVLPCHFLTAFKTKGGYNWFGESL